MLGIIEVDIWGQNKKEYTCTCVCQATARRACAAAVNVGQQPAVLAPARRVQLGGTACQLDPQVSPAKNECAPIHRFCALFERKGIEWENRAWCGRRRPSAASAVCSHGACLLALEHGPAWSRICDGATMANKRIWAVVCGVGRSSAGQFMSAAMCAKEASVGAAGSAMSGFSESEGDDAEAIEQGGREAHLTGGQEAVIEDRTKSGDGGSDQCTGRVDPHAPWWTKRYLSSALKLHSQYIYYTTIVQSCVHGL